MHEVVILDPKRNWNLIDGLRQAERCAVMRGNSPGIHFTGLFAMHVIFVLLL